MRVFSTHFRLGFRTSIAITIERTGVLEILNVVRDSVKVEGARASQCVNIEADVQPSLASCCRPPDYLSTVRLVKDNPLVSLIARGQQQWRNASI